MNHLTRKLGIVESLFEILHDLGAMKELYFATGQHVIGASFWLGVVTFHEQLFCTFSHVVPLVSANTAELFADSVIDTIQKACISQSFATLIDKD
jgi:hypothetical protein